MCTLFWSRDWAMCLRSFSVKSLHERSKEWRRDCGSAKMLASALAESLPIEFAARFISVIELLLCRPSTSTRPPSSTNRFSLRFRLMSESFPLKARPRYRPPCSIRFHLLTDMYELPQCVFGYLQDWDLSVHFLLLVALTRDEHHGWWSYCATDLNELFAYSVFLNGHLQRRLNDYYLN